MPRLQVMRAMHRSPRKTGHALVQHSQSRPAHSIAAMLSGYPRSGRAVVLLQIRVMLGMSPQPYGKKLFNRKLCKNTRAKFCKAFKKVTTGALFADAKPEGSEKYNARFT